LADSYTSLPDYRPNYKVCGTRSPVEADWQSPFVGKSIADVANEVRNVPKPPKPMCTLYFAVLQKDLYERTGKLLFCKILPEGGEVDRTTNEIYGAEMYRKQGRSLMCEITSGESQDESGDKGEFEVQWIEVLPKNVGVFYSVFERHTWWELGDCAYD
jgi:hypothetical protein